MEKYHTINGQSVAVKKALPKDQSGKHRGGGGYNNNYNNNYDDDNNYGGNSYGGGSGGGNFNFNNLPNNFAQMAQKMFQAAAMQNYNNNNKGSM